MPRRHGGPAFSWAWRAALVAALALLAAVDQWRYVLAIGHGERDRLADAVRLNPYDSGAYLRLAQVESAAGDRAAAAAALRRAVDVNPQNPVLAQALVRRLIEAGQFDEAYPRQRRAAGALARRRRRPRERRRPRRSAGRRRGGGAAGGREAVARDPSQRRVHLYLAERLDARGATRDALSHYRRYLELVTRATGRTIGPIRARSSPSSSSSATRSPARARSTSRARNTIWRSAWLARPA